MSLGLGMLLTLFAVILFYWQYKKKNIDRNVILLFSAFVLGLVGLWMIFDWIIIKTWI
ncbi:hypothetical protein [Jeotgalibacillus proteolyticus]|uniref:hypothetical protein n=1 Tax=Jeotgalibacillus proteolyticus TaxID=2082395 RepID=UPI00143181D7|nr:hypothetical protein [Jeotgalibacillus proteolyticus]